MDNSISSPHLPRGVSIFDRMPPWLRKLMGRRPTHQELTEEDDVSSPTSPNASKSKDLEAQKAKKESLRESLTRQWKLLRTLLPYLWPRGEPWLRFRVILSLACLVLAKVINVTTPLAYKSVIDVLSVVAEGKASEIQYPWHWILLYGFGLIGNQFFSNLRDSIFVKVAQHAMALSAVETFGHLHSLSISYHVQRKTGGVLRGIDRGTRGISFLTSFVLFNTAPLVIELALVSFILLFQMPWLTIIVLAVVAFYVIFTLAVTEWRRKFRTKMNEAENKANDRAVDSLLNFETVKVFSNEQFETERYREALSEYNQLAVKSQNSLAFLNIGQATIISLGQLALMFLTALYVYRGWMSVGSLVAVNSWMLMVYSPLSFLGSSYNVIKQSLIDIESMFKILDEKQTVVDPAMPERVGLVERGEVEFDNVKFSYKQEGKDAIEVLKNISFTVKPGKQLAIVGGSGAGKSTIVKLCFRFFDVDDGSIRIDGVDVRDMKQTDLRKSIGIVPQDTVLFNDTIKYNLQYGNLQATDEELREAARMANLLDFIENLPDGWNTRVGERGLRLSGGEKQRVSIARAILKRAPIIIFDEATSSLDTVTEKQIQDNLRELFKGRTTTIVLAHRLSTIIDSDEIIVVKQGTIIERGNFEQLLAIEDGEFRKLWLKQSEKKEERQKELEGDGSVASPESARPRGHPPHGH